MNSHWLKYLPRFISNKLNGKHNLQNILTNTSWLFADKVLRMGGGLLISIWIARQLGPEQFGKWNYAIAFTSLFGALASLGLDNIVIRELVKTPEKESQLLGTAFTLKLFGGVLAFAVTVLAIALIRNNQPFMFLLVAITSASFIFQSVNVIDFYFQSKTQSKYTVFAANISFTIMVIVKIILLITHAPLIAFVFASLAESLITAIFLMIIYSKLHQHFTEWKNSWSMAKNLLKNSWPLMLSGVAILIYMRIDQIMIGEMLGEKALGIFSAAVRISEVWYFIPVIICSSVYPALTNHKLQSEIKYHQSLEKLFKLMVLLSILISIPIFILSDLLIKLIYGHDFIGAGTVLAIHTLSTLFVFLGVASGQWYINENLQKLVFYRTALGALINIFLNLILIPNLGIKGAAISSLISQISASYLFDFINQKTKIMFFLKTNSILQSIGINK